MIPTYKKIGALQVVDSTTQTFTIHDRYRLQGIDLWLNNAAGDSPTSSSYRSGAIGDVRIIANGETIQQFTPVYETEGRNWYNYHTNANIGEAGNVSARFSDPALYSRGFGLEAYAHSALATAGLEDLRIEIDWTSIAKSALYVARAEVWLIVDPNDATPYKGTPHRRTEYRKIPPFDTGAGLQTISLDVTRRRLIKAIFWTDDDFNTVALWGINNAGQRIELISTIDEQQLENHQKRSGRDYNTNFVGLDFDLWHTGAGLWTPEWQQLNLEIEWTGAPSGNIHTDYVFTP